MLVVQGVNSGLRDPIEWDASPTSSAVMSDNSSRFQATPEGVPTEAGFPLVEIGASSSAWESVLEDADQRTIANIGGATALFRDPHAWQVPQQQLVSSDVAKLFLVRRLHLRRWTPAAGALLELSPTAIARPMPDVTLTSTIRTCSRMSQAYWRVATSTRARSRARTGDGTTDMEMNRTGAEMLRLPASVNPSLSGSDRKRADMRYRETLDRLRLQVPNAPVASLEWADDTAILRWSPAAERIFGWSEGEARQSLLFGLGLFPAAHSEACSGMIRALLEEDLRRQTEEMAAAARRKNEFLAMLGHELRIRLRLPLDLVSVRIEEETMDRGSAAATEAVHDRAPSTGKHVLVVDDNAELVDATKMLLEALGHQVSAAFSGADALRLVQTAAPDLVLLDIGLPDIDGIEVARRLAGFPRRSGFRLVAISGYSASTFAEQAKLFDGHLLKPVGLQELQRVLAL